MTAVKYIKHKQYQHCDAKQTKPTLVTYLTFHYSGTAAHGTTK